MFVGAAVRDRNFTFLSCSSVRRERGHARGQRGYRGPIITASNKWKAQAAPWEGMEGKVLGRHGPKKEPRP